MPSTAPPSFWPATTHRLRGRITLQQADEGQEGPALWSDDRQVEILREPGLGEQGAEASEGFVGFLGQHKASGGVRYRGAECRTKRRPTCMAIEEGPPPEAELGCRPRPGGDAREQKPPTKGDRERNLASIPRRQEHVTQLQIRRAHHPRHEDGFSAVLVREWPQRPVQPPWSGGVRMGETASSSRSPSTAVIWKPSSTRRWK